VTRGDTRRAAKGGRRPNRSLYAFIVPILSLAVITVVAVTGVCLAERGSHGESVLTVVVLLVVTIAIVSGPWYVYCAIRILRLPAFRWMVRGFGREPGSSRVPGRVGSPSDNIRKGRTGRQRLCFGLGYGCCGIGIALIAYRVVWRWIARIRHESTVELIPTVLFFSGVLLFVLGSQFLKLSTPKTAPKDNDSMD